MMRVLRIHPDDDVAVAMADLAPGETAVEGVAVRQPIPAGHKVAVKAIRQGEPVIKFAQPIGVATADIAPGEHVHVHNLGFQAGMPLPAAPRRAPPAHSGGPATFKGYLRADGRAATRNYVGVITTVNCSATVARLIADRFRGAAMEKWPNVDGVVALTHRTGCGMQTEGEAMDVLRRTTAGYIRHANFAGVLLVGLGCEMNQPDRLLAEEGLAVSDRLRVLTIQETGGTSATVRAGEAIVREMLDVANRDGRVELPASHLSLGLQCGGSDGFSALSANPALGVAADLLVAHGGTAILSETPEIYGAENMLFSRAASPEVTAALKARLAWWDEYTAKNGQDLDNNPSPGNKKGGLTTILEKSLGAVAKGGTSPLAGVYAYAEPVTQKGFVFMDTPGYDPVSATGQVAGGANLICFTTGRGSCFGCKPAPSLKLATNTPLWEKMGEDMDINCGTILDGSETVEQVGRRIFARILATASGEPTASESLGYGEDEFVPWVLGATM